MQNSLHSHEEAAEQPSCRNQWHLYEWLKQRYMWTGTRPSYDEARSEFPELSLEEMGDGFTEFRETVKRYEKGA